MSQDKPVFILDDNLVDFGAGVVKSVFPSASDEECCAAAAGAFMAMLSEREDGNVVFGYSDDGSFFSFNISQKRTPQ